jgi:hypothetical protein
MEKNISLAATLIFGLRLVIKGAGIGDACALGALCALYGFILFLDSKKEVPINDQVKSELEQLRSAVNNLKLAKTVGRF